MDKQDFLSRLALLLKELRFDCMAWALMSNHYHLLIRVSEEPLSHLMRRLLSGYGTTYNLRNKRSGYVFQNRYKSILCDADDYFLELVRYIHLNPIKAKIVKDINELNTYPWTGHSAIMHKNSNDWQNTDEVLLQYSVQKAAARRRYSAFISDGITEKLGDMSGGGLIRSYGGWQEISKLQKSHEARIGDERILGDSDFVEQAIKNDETKLEEELLLKQKGWDLEKLVKYVCQYFDVTQDQISTKGRDNTISYAKSVICYLGNVRLGISSTQLGARLNISQSSVSRSVKRGR
ncbi:MAG: helix-turn-helix domain-containing protein, partial [Thiohalomonadales bacterium]